MRRSAAERERARYEAVVSRWDEALAELLSLVDERKEEEERPDAGR